MNNVDRDILRQIFVPISIYLGKCFFKMEAVFQMHQAFLSSFPTPRNLTSLCAPADYICIPVNLLLSFAFYWHYYCFLVYLEGFFLY